VEDAELLTGRHARDDEEQRGQDHRMEHKIIVSPQPDDVNGVCRTLAE
jgi:hypothetical protein